VRCILAIVPGAQIFWKLSPGHKSAGGKCDSTERGPSPKVLEVRFWTGYLARNNLETYVGTSSVKPAVTMSTTAQIRSKFTQALRRTWRPTFS